MRKFLSNLFTGVSSMTKLPYYTLTLAAMCFIVTVVISYTNINILLLGRLQVIFLLSGILFLWLGCLSYVHDARRDRSELRRLLRLQFHETKQITAKLFETLDANHVGIIREYDKQAFNTLISIQELRIDVLESRESYDDDIQA